VAGGIYRDGLRTTYDRSKKRLGMVRLTQIGTQMCERLNDWGAHDWQIFVFCADIFETVYS
jgi:hypothetical protein